MLKKILGIILIGIGIILGLYLGVWICFVGGIMGIASAIDTNHVTGTIIAWNIIKILLSTLIGSVSFYIPSAIGFLLIAKSEEF